jgi:hypothetical protein
MAGNDAGDADKKGVGDRFPALKQLEEDAEREKLNQAVAEARAKALTAKLPSAKVELARDTVTAGEKTTGLARVLVQMCSSVLADDVAELTLDAARESTDAQGERSYRIRIVDDPNAFRDVDVARILQGQLGNLTKRIDDYAPTKAKPAAAQEALTAALLAVGPIVGLGIQLGGLASKLLAREYHVSGAEVAVDDLGFDLLLARRLMDKCHEDETLVVEVDRILPTPEPQIVVDVWELALKAERRVAPAVAAAAVARAEAQAELDADEAAITATDEEILELVKKLGGTGTGNAGNVASELGKLRDVRAGLANGLAARRKKLAETREQHDRGTALLKDIEDFLTQALTPAEGGRPPIMQAARVASLSAPEPGEATHFLFARLVAGGVDQTIETKVGADRWFAICGSTVEFAVMSAGGELRTSGVRPVFQTSDMKLGDPDSIRHERPGYVPYARQKAEAATEPD